MARVIVVGGHGKVALQLARILTERGDDVSSVFRNPDQSQSGSGLGLAIVKSVVDKHGGEVVLGEAPGGGLLASVRLPLAMAEAPQPML